MKNWIRTMLDRFTGKKRIALIAVLALLWTAVCVGLVFLHLTWLVIVLNALLLLLIATVFFARRAYDKWLAEEKPSSYFQDLGKRNMDAIAVGSTKAWKHLRLKGLEDRVYSCLTYRRSLTMDYATLKTFFSHVRPGGKAFLFIDWTEINRIGETIYARDWKYSHPHVFLEMGVKSNNITKLNPLTHDTRFLFGYFFQSLLKRSGLSRIFGWRRTRRKNLGLDASRVKQLAQRISGIVQFCNERGIEPVILLLGGDADTNRANDVLLSDLKERNADTSVSIAPTARDMNAAVQRHLREAEETNGKHGA